LVQIHATGMWNLGISGFAEPVATPALRDCVHVARALSNTRAIALKTLDDRQLYMHSSDPLAKMRVRCIPYDRLGFKVGDDILVEQHKRGELQIKLNELSAETGVVTFYLIWEGTSDSSLDVQIDDFSVLQLPGHSHCIIGRITCLTDSASIYPTPKPEKWTFFFEPTELGDNGLDVLDEIQPRPANLIVGVKQGRDLSCSSPYVSITYGNNKTKTPCAPQSAVWNYQTSWPLQDDWTAGHREITFHVYSPSITGKTALGTAVFELDQMRLPYFGELRLRPGPKSKGKKVGGHIFVQIEVPPNVSSLESASNHQVS